MKTRVARVTDVPPGAGRVVEVAGRLLALFNVDGMFYALDNTCPHRGGPLGDGDLQGPIVSCPWHAWRWDVRSGLNVNNPAVRVPSIPVTVQGEDIFVELG